MHEPARADYWAPVVVDEQWPQRGWEVSVVEDAVVELRSEAASVAQARARARSWAESYPSEISAAVEVIVSELVTNAIRHGRGSVRIQLRTASHEIRIGVSDVGPGCPHTAEAGVEQTYGRGLQIVQQLTSRGSVQPGPDATGKTVWAHVSLTR